MQNVFRHAYRFAYRLSTLSVIALGSAGLVLATPASAAPPTLLAQNLLAQHGLGIGFLQTMTQTELALAFAQHSTVGSCVALPQGGNGSLKTLARTNGGNDYTAEIYYDNACANIYVNGVLSASGGNENVIRFIAKLTFYSAAGAKVGTARVTQRVTSSPQGSHFSQLSDVGTFTPTRNGLPVKFGFDCSEPAGEPASANIKCDVGVAQTVPMVSQDIASLGSAAATITQISGASYEEAFTGTAKLSRGSNLGVSAPTSHSLAITGAASNAGQATSSGSVGLLSSFLGAPAQWSVRATGLNAKFAVTLHDGASPFFSGAITQLDTSAKVATFRVDIGGNGFVLFSNNQKIKVSNWLMVNEPVN